MTLYLLDADENQDMMDACEFMINVGKEIENMYPYQPNFWCEQCANWVAKPMKHLDQTHHDITRAEPVRK